MKTIIKRSPQLFTSNSSEWETPQELFDSLNAKYSFSISYCYIWGGQTKWVKEKRK